MIDLTTKYLGLELKNPLIASASPLSKDLEGVQKLEESGVAAVVLHSLFEEEITHEQLRYDHFLSYGAESYAEAVDYFSDALPIVDMQAEHYLEELAKIKESVSIPVIASLNGVSDGGWMHYAKKLQEAGADALELNITHIPCDPFKDAAEVEDLYLNIVRHLREEITIAINLKMNRYFSAPANIAKKFVEAGIDGLTLFDNPVEVDIDLENLLPVHRANLTSTKEKSETLRWCAILYNKFNVSLCANTGIHSGLDVLKAIMSGADTVSFTSTLLQQGEIQTQAFLKEIEEWMLEHEYHSTDQMRGSISLDHTSKPEFFERNSYRSALQSFRR